METKKLTVVVNQQTVLEYDKDSVIEDSQLAFLDRMDADMNRGFKIRGELVTNPDSMQRARFVAMNLIKALQQDNDAIVSASCSYLVNRRPALVEVQANDEGSSVSIDFVEEQ